MTEHRIRYAPVYDHEAPAHDQALFAAAGIQVGEQVLDVGCGTGFTTRRAARLASPGRVLGVDVSGPLIEHARELTRLEGLVNAEYVEADAQTYDLGVDAFDVCLSRFGVMFFADPSAAFANLARSLRPGGRIALLVWQRLADNEWWTAIDEALAVTETGDAPFSLADPDVVRDQLSDFEDLSLQDVSAPVRFGSDVETGYGFVSELRDSLARLDELDAEDPAEAAATRARLRRMVEDHAAEDGVWFGSRAWLITARRQ